MRVLLSAAGRAFLRTGAVAFLALATGILAAPNLRQAAALAGAASLAAIVAGVRAIRVFVPSISKQLAASLHVPVAYAEVVITLVTTALFGFIVLVEGVLSAPNLDAARAAGLAALLAVGDALVRVGQAWLTPGEPGGAGISTPEQPVPAAALSTPMPTNPGGGG
jgi:hypothetical protein